MTGFWQKLKRNKILDAKAPPPQTEESADSDIATSKSAETPIEPIWHLQMPDIEDLRKLADQNGSI